MYDQVIIYVKKKENMRKKVQKDRGRITFYLSWIVI